MSLPRFFLSAPLVIVTGVLIDSALPVDLHQTVSGSSRGPCVRFGADGVWRATRTADGPATVHLRSVTEDRVEARAWGPGANRALEGAAALVGASDGDGGLAAGPDPRVRGLARRFRRLRIGASGNPFETLVPVVLEQKVQTQSARASYRAMVVAHRSPAPSAPGAPPLLLPPTAEWLLEQPSWVWHRWGVEGKRAATIRTAASYAHRVAETATMPVDAARRRLEALPGIGPWSVAEIAAVAFGDADAVSVGDFWLAHVVCHNLAGEARGTDERMLTLLAPWAGQRGRVCRLLMLGGSSPPRFGPRLPFSPIAAI